MLNLNFRDSLFPTGWIRFPYNGIPERPTLGIAGGIHRRIVREVFPRSQFLTMGGLEFTFDEHWVASVSRWLRCVHLLRNRKELVPDRVHPLLDRMGRCSPNGYVLVGEDVRPWYYCRSPVCPFCYARGVVSRYQLLRAAVKRAPGRRTPWITSVCFLGDRRELSRVVNRIRPAAAVSVSVPAVGRYAGSWVHRAILLSDDRRRLDGPDRWVTKLSGAARTVKYVSGALRYPPMWRGRGGVHGLIRALTEAAITPGRQCWGVYGAARADYTPGKGLLDFVDAEP